MENRENYTEKYFIDKFEQIKKLGLTFLYNIKYGSKSQETKKAQESSIQGKLKKKIKLATKYLKDLCDHPEQIKEFNYKNANVFVLFLEAFALQDKICEDEEKEECSAYIGKENRKRIKDIRILLLDSRKSKKEIFQPNYFNKFVVNDTKNLSNDGVKVESQVATFFNNLMEFASEVEQKIKTNIKPENKAEQNIINSIIKIPQEKYEKLVKLDDLKTVNEKVTEILLENESKGDSKVKINYELQELFENIKTSNILPSSSKSNIDSPFLQLLKEAYDVSFEKNDDNVEKCIFNLLCNIHPIFNGRQCKEMCKEMANLRNELIHNFHKSHNATFRIIDFKESIYRHRNILFRIYFAEKAFETLKEINIIEEIKEKERDKRKGIKEIMEIGKEKILSSTIRKFENILQTCQKDICSKITEETIAPPEISQYFEYTRICTDECFEEIYDDIENMLYIYFTFIVIIDKQNWKSGVAFKEEKDNKFRGFRDHERRKLLEYFREIQILQKKYSDVTEPEAEQEKKLQLEKEYEEVKKKIELLLKHIGIENYPFEHLKTFFSGNDDIRSSIASSEPMTELGISIREFICSKKYDYIEEKQITEISEKIPNNIESKILKIDIFLDRFKTAKSILNSLSSLNKYELDFKNIEEAFMDEDILNLIAKKISNSISKCENDTFRQCFFYSLIRMLISLESASPLLARILMKGENIQIIEEEDLNKLFELLSHPTRVIHLSKLLRNKKRNLYPFLCELIMQKEVSTISSCIAALKPIFIDFNHSEKVLFEFKEKINDDTFDSIPKDKLCKIIMEILKFLNEFNYEDIQKSRLDLVQELGLVKKDDATIQESWYHISKIYTRKGRFSEEIEKKNGYFDEALDCLKKIDLRSNPFPINLLILNQEAYINTLWKKHAEASGLFRKFYDSLLSEFKICNDQPFMLKENDYREIVNSDIYKKIEKTRETKKYLNINHVLIERARLISCHAFAKQKESKELKGKWKVEKLEDAKKKYLEAIEILKNTHSNFKKFDEGGNSEMATKFAYNFGTTYKKYAEFLDNYCELLDDKIKPQVYMEELDYLCKSLENQNELYKLRPPRFFQPENNSKVVLESLFKEIEAVRSKLGFKFSILD